MTNDPARTHLDLLARAGSSVDLGPKGVAAFVSPALHAYQALAADRDALARLEPELSRLVRDGEPGAVIYAALLLRALGRDVRAMLAVHDDDRRPCVIWPGGCSPRMMWLAEAVRWIHGEEWLHPAHAAQEHVREWTGRLAALGDATWFELPSAQALEFKEKGIRVRDIDGVWTHRFLELVTAPRVELRALRVDMDAMLAHASVLTQLYVALVLRVIDRDAGDRALAQLAAAGGMVPCHRRKGPAGVIARLLGGDGYRVVEVPVADVVAELASWNR